MLRTHQRHDLARKFLYGQFVFLALALLLFALPTPAHAASCSGTLDYGDAPSSYGVACANANAALRIGGVTPDEEASSAFSANADGDGTQDSFINPLTPIDMANSWYTWTVPVRNTSGSSATLAGWIDFNANGSFESSEGVSATVPNNSTAATLTWTIPHTGTTIYTGTLPITTYVRLRISPASGIGPTDNLPAATSDGEVEDYAVAIVESDVCAPGTSFYVINGSSLPWSIQQLNGSTGALSGSINPSPDQLNGIAVDRYRGIIYYQDATSSNPATPANNIYAYSVLNGTETTVTSDASAAPLSIPFPDDGWRNASGAFANGKYYAGLDGEDSTASQNQTGTIYEITLGTNGTTPISARVLVTPTGTVGGDTVTNAVNYGDLIVVANRLYVTYYVSIGGGNFHHVFDVYDINSQIRLSRQDLGTNSDGNPIQLGRDGNGQIWAIRNNTATTASTYPINTSSNTITGWSGSPQASVSAGIADASECLVVPMDFGDAPVYYSPNVGPLAPRSTLSSNIRLGTVSSQAIISDTHGNASATANGDDTTGPGDDEDALSLVPSLSSSASSYSLPNLTVFNNSGSPVFLYGWVDFDRDGVFEPSERVTATIPSSASSQSITLTWTIPGGHATAGQSFIRLRISSSTVTTSTLGTGNDGAFLPTGFAPTGEIEDYPLTIGSTTAVILSRFEAQVEGSPLSPPLVKGVGGSALAGLSIGAMGAALSMAGLVRWRRKRFQNFPIARK